MTRHFATSASVAPGEMCGLAGLMDGGRRVGVRMYGINWEPWGMAQYGMWLPLEVVVVYVVSYVWWVGGLVGFGRFGFGGSLGGYE